MEFGNYFGLTVPQLMVLDFHYDSKTFSDGITMLNNPNDVKRLQNLKEELKYFKTFLENNLTFAYENPKDRKLERGVYLYETAIAKGQDTSSLRHIKTEEEYKQARLQLASAKKGLLNQVKTSKGALTLSKEEVKILSFFYEQLDGFDRLDRHVSYNTFTEIKVFGRNLYSFIASKNQKYLRMRVTEILTQKQTSKSIINQIYNDVRRDIKIMRDLIVDEEDIELDNNSNIIKDIQFKMTKKFGLVLELNYTAIPKENENFLYKLCSLGLLKSGSPELTEHNISYSQLKTLYTLYENVKLLDVERYNIMFDLDLNAEQYEKIFDRLDDIGFVGLNLYGTNFFFNALNSMYLTRPMEYKIPSDSELAMIIEQIERLLANKLQFGEVI